MISEEIPAALSGERLDRVVSLLTGMSRADASALVATGEVLVNGAPRTAKALRLQEGDQLSLRWSPTEGEISLTPERDVAFDVRYADEDVVVVAKPAGLVVHPGAGNSSGTLVHGLLARFPELAAAGDPGRPGIVHRIDKETSGLLVVARSAVAYDSLVAQLSERTVHRRYVALAWGEWEVAAGTIEAPVGRSDRDPTRMTVSERGKPAITHYRVEQRFSDPVSVALLHCRLETGRTHQIRVHLQAIGHPVVGDERYGGARSTLPSPRMFLHAAELGFEHPVTGERLEFQEPLPADLQAVLDRLDA